MKLDFTQTARYKAGEVADKPGVYRFAFSEPLLSDKVPLYLVLLMVLGYGLTFGLAWVFHVTQIKFFDKASDFFFYGGAMTNAVWSGQIWRPLTSAFLHGSIMHIVMNVLNFVLAAAAARVVFARRGWLTVFLVSAYVGCLITILLTPAAIVVGASVGLMGLFGALVAGELRLRRLDKKDCPADRMFELKPLVILLALNLVLEHLIPNIGHIAHAAGLSLGFLLGLWLPLNGGQTLIASRQGLLKVSSVKRVGRSGSLKAVSKLEYTLADEFDPKVDFVALVADHHGRSEELSVYTLHGNEDRAVAMAGADAAVVTDRFDVAGLPSESAEEEARRDAEAKKKEVRKPLVWRLLALLPLGWLWHYIYQSWTSGMTMDKADLQWLHFLPPTLAEPAISLFAVLGALLVSGSFAYFIFSMIESIVWSYCSAFFKALGKKRSGSEADNKDGPDAESKP